MKLSDYVAQFLADRGVKHVFGVSGGASLHLLHSVADSGRMELICPQHEQAGAMSADAYARVTGQIGCAMATSGPGVTNMMTGACCAYYDSVPVMYISGNVSTFRMKRSLGVRQIGFQETEAVAIYQTVTKYAVTVEDPKRIRYEMEKGYHLATSGRPGPVLIDIPDNVQREQIEPDRLEGYVPPSADALPAIKSADINRVIELIKKSRRPVIVYGWGIRLAGAGEEARMLAEKLGIPVAPTWAALDILAWDHPQFIGTFGTHGTRYANFAVQNADLILSVGSRLDTKSTGSPPSTFARDAARVMVDIDPTEIAKFDSLGLSLDVAVRGDAKSFLKALLARIDGSTKPQIQDWTDQIRQWKEKYPACSPEYYKDRTLNPYVFVQALSRESQKNDTIFVDTGCAVAWMMQAFEVKQGQRVYHDFNNTAMGYGLPGSVGASLALGGRPITCVTGDGSLQMNIQEMATVIRHKLPIKIFLINNQGYSMIQQTQDQWLNSKYVASSIDGGLAFPDFVKVAQAYGFPTLTISTNAEAPAKIRQVMSATGPMFCNVEIASSYRVIPQCRFGRAIEDSEPLLPRAEFMKNMIVKPEKASLSE